VHFSCGLGWSLARRPFYNHINSVKAQKELKAFTSSPLHLMLSWSTRWLSRKKKHHNQYVNVTSTGMIGSGSIWKVGGPEKKQVYSDNIRSQPRLCRWNLYTGADGLWIWIIIYYYAAFKVCRCHKDNESQTYSKPQGTVLFSMLVEVRTMEWLQKCNK